MATSARLGVLILAAVVSSARLGLARPSSEAVGRQRVSPYWYDHTLGGNPSPVGLTSPYAVLPYWRGGGVYDHTLGGQPPPVGLTSPYYVEPSSRDLAIDFTVGGDEKPHSYTSGGPIRSGHVTREEYRDGYPEDVNVGVFADVPAARYPSSGAAEGGWSRGVYSRGDGVGYPADVPGARYPSSGAAEGGWSRGVYSRGDGVGYPANVPAARYASSGAAEGGWSRGVYPSGDGVDGYPAVMSQPLDHKVGEIKLRNDQGYQLSMHVPPSTVGDRPGVLKIDMKATLYKPLYY